MQVDDLPAFDTRPSARAADLTAVESHFGCSLPNDYKHFVLKHGGGEGWVGEHYLVLWSAAELIPFNVEYQVQECIPGLIAFGSTGGGEGFGFDTRILPYVVCQFPFIGMSPEDALPVARSFEHLLKRMKTESDSLL